MKGIACHVLVTSLLLMDGLVVSFQSSSRSRFLRHHGIKGEISMVRVDSSSSSEYPPFKAANKEPKKVFIDPKTGLFRPVKSVEKKKSSTLDWDGLKSLVYNGLDLLTTQVPRAVQKIQQTTREISNNSDETPSQSIYSPGTSTLYELSSASLMESRSNIIGGYKEREEEFLNTLKDTPGKRIVKQFKPYNTVTEVPAAEDPLIQLTAFEAFKAAVYGGIDTVSAKSGSPTTKTKPNEEPIALTQPGSQRLSSISLQTCVVPARLLSADEEFLRAMEDLDSENPIQRLAAGYKVRRMMEKDEDLNRQRKREEQIAALKNSIYQTGDAIVSGGRVLAKLPKKVSQTFDKTLHGTKATIDVVKTVPEKVKESVQDVKQIAEEVQQSVRASVETTIDIIEKAKQLPSQIKSKVRETTEQTRNVLDGISTAAQEVTTTSEVLLGLRKPIPKPPKTPPQKKDLEEWSASKLGWTVLSMTGSIAGKVTWAVGKGAAQLVWMGAELAFNQAKQAMEEAASKENKRNELAAAAFSSVPTMPIRDDPREAKTGTQTLVPEMDQLKQPEENSSFTKLLTRRKEEINVSVLDLEGEIAEALLLAEQAMETARKEMDEGKQR